MVNSCKQNVSLVTYRRTKYKWDKLLGFFLQMNWPNMANDFANKSKCNGTLFLF